ncbi:MAG: DHA2 family efflux MFS transporter permease subunit [Planctomycetes bacterium]|nr:DHA2 family efflux MFS transporter permease subunit [Planctomycetota bacterium]
MSDAADCEKGARPGKGHAAFHAPFNPWLIAVVATMATFMEVLDTSIANVSLPHIAGNLGASINDSTWVLTSYLVANAIVLPASAWLSSVIGRRNYYMLSVALFTISSLLCGLAPNLEALVGFRLLQGLAGGGLQPLTQAILVDTFPPKMRGMGMAAFGLTVVVAPVIGPTLGGWITDNYEWRWVFLINIPVGVAALWLSSRYITDPPFLKRRTGNDRWGGDFLGLGLVAVGLASMQMMLDLGEREEWFASNLIRTCAALTVICLVGGVYRAFVHRKPMIDFRVLRDRNLALSCVYMAIFGGVLYGTTALLPLMMQQLLGYTAQLSGLVLSPGGMVIAVLMPLVGWSVGKIDARWMILFGIVMVALSLEWMAGFSLDVDFATLVYARMLQGFGLAFIFVPINTIAYATVDADSRNAASSLISIARNIGGSIGIGYTSTMVARLAQTFRTHLTEHVGDTEPAARAALAAIEQQLRTVDADPVRNELLARAMLSDSVDRQATMLAYLDQFAFLGAAFLILVPVVLLMRRARTDHPAELAIE